MKKYLTVLLMAYGMYAVAQSNEPKKKSDNSKNKSEASVKAEDLKAKKERFAINSSDPSYPQDLLAKEKKEIEIMELKTKNK
jgi:hypothetical protein